MTSNVRKKVSVANENTLKDVKEPGFLYQYLATFSGCLSIICCGIQFGWPSPSLPILLNKKSTISITEDEGSWLAAIPCIGAPLGSLPAAYIADKIGRKRSMLLTAPLYIISFLCIALATSPIYFFIGRFTAGIADGVGFTVFPMYVGEIADPKIRGFLSSCLQISMTVGCLFINIVGFELNISHTAYISLLFPVFHFILFLMMPESPYYLILINRKEEARKSFVKFLGSNDVNDKLEVVDQAVLEDLKNSSNIFSLFATKSNRIAVCIIFGLRIIQQASGADVLMFYTAIIFENINSSTITSHVATLIYFTLQFVSTVIASFMSDKLGRKPLLISSIVGSGITLGLTTIYFYFTEKTLVDMSKFYLVPIICLFLYVVIFNFGMGPIPILMLGEMFPTDVKALALCLADILFCIIVTLTAKFFQYTKDNFGNYVPFASFTLVCILGLIFVIIWVPETKGKSLEEIQNYLRGKDRQEIIEKSNTNSRL